MAAFILPILAGAAGIAGGLFPPKTSGTQDTTSSSHGTSATDTNTLNNGAGLTNTTGHQVATNEHNLSPEQQALASALTGGALAQANSATDLSGYRNAGLQQINDASGAQSTALNNILAARGLSYSPAAGNSIIQGEQNRLNQQTSFLQGLPLLQRSLQDKAQAGLVSAFSALPTDTTQTGDSTGQASSNFSNTGQSNTTGVQDTSQTGHTNQTGTVSGNPLAGGLSGAAAGLAAPSSTGSGSTLGDIIKLFGGGD